MPKGTNQKLKLLYLMKFLLDRTDENHSVDMAQILAELERNNVTAERKSIYDDIAQLIDYGIDIVGEKVGRNYYYKVVSREFEIPELKLLVDAVQSSKFITVDKSNELIKKLETLASHYEANTLHRQVYVTDRVKASNENILYNIDVLHEAMGGNKQVSFKYFSWLPERKREFHHNGDLLKVSPWALIWDDENYYLVAFDSQSNIIKHYRVDKMVDVTVYEAARQGKENFDKSKVVEYTKKHFGMFSGTDANVTLECENRLAGVIYDRFGLDIMTPPVGKDKFKVNVKVSVSDQFLGWIFSLGGQVKITSPQWVVDKMKETIIKQSELYK